MVFQDEVVIQFREAGLEELAHKTSTYIEQIGGTTKKTSVAFDNMGNVMNYGISETTRNLKGFQMQWLSVMFMGMQVQRTFGNIWKNMITDLKKVGGAFHPTNMALTRMEASFTFLKVAIMDAMGPMIQMFVIWLANLAVTIGEMDPEQLKLIGLGLLAIIGVAGIAFWVSQVTLLINSLKDLATIRYGDIAKGIPTVTEALKGLMAIPWLLPVTIGVLIAWGLIKYDEEIEALIGRLSEEWQKKWAEPIRTFIHFAFDVNIGEIMSWLEANLFTPIRNWLDAKFTALGLDTTTKVQLIKPMFGEKDGVWGASAENLAEAKTKTDELTVSATKLATITPPAIINEMKTLITDGVIDNIVTKMDPLILSFDRFGGILDAQIEKVNRLKAAIDAIPNEKVINIRTTSSGSGLGDGGNTYA